MIRLANNPDHRSSISTQFDRTAAALAANPFALIRVFGIQALAVDLHERHGHAIDGKTSLDRDHAHGIPRLGDDLDDPGGVGAALFPQGVFVSDAINWSDGSDDVIVKEFAEANLKANEQTTLRSNLLEFRIEGASLNFREPRAAYGLAWSWRCSWSCLSRCGRQAERIEERGGCSALDGLFIALHAEKKDVRAEGTDEQTHPGKAATHFDEILLTGNATHLGIRLLGDFATQLRHQRVAHRGFDLASLRPVPGVSRQKVPVDLIIHTWGNFH